MAIYQVKGPDGTVHQIQGPDGASDQEVITQAQKLFAGQTQSPNQGIPSSVQAPTNVQGPSAASNIADFAGVTGLGKGIAQVGANAELGGQNQKNIEKETASNNTIMGIINKLRSANPSANRNQAIKDKITSLLSQVNNPYKNNNLENIASNGEGYQSNGQIVGSALQTAGNILSAGQLGKGMTTLKLADKAIETAPVVTGFGQKLLGLAGRTAYNAGLSGVNNIGQGLQDKTINNAEDLLNAGQTGAELGGAFSLGGEALQGVKKVAGKVISGAAGTLSGAGGSALQEAAANPSKELIDAMRGKTSGSDFLSTAHDAVDKVIQQQKSDYTTAIGKVINSGEKIDKKAVQGQLKGVLDKYGITLGKGSAIDLSASNISQGSSGDVQKVVNEITGNKDWSVKGVDNLKQRINDYINYNSSNNLSSKTQGLIKQLGRGITEELNKVPGYTEATKPYSKTMEFRTQLGKLIKSGGNADQAIAAKKLMGIVKDNANPIHQQLIEELKNLSGIDLKNEAAGHALSSLFPNGIQRAIEGTGAAGAAMFGLHPAALPLATGVIAASPRLSGEAAVKYGQASKIAGKVVPRSLRNILTRQSVMRLSNASNPQK